MTRPLNHAGGRTAAEEQFLARRSPGDDRGIVGAAWRFAEHLEIPAGRDRGRIAGRVAAAVGIEDASRWHLGLVLDGSRGELGLGVDQVEFEIADLLADRPATSRCDKEWAEGSVLRARQRHIIVVHL